MAEIIRMNVEDLKNSSSHLKAKGNELEEWIQEVSTLVHTLLDSWEGEAARAYSEQYDRLLPELKRTRELIETISVQVDQTVQVTQDLDSTLASKLR